METILNISPKEFTFQRSTTNILTMENITTTQVAYKVKTTAPKSYCVRPNTGVIPPKSSVEVQVTLTASKDTSSHGRDKFLIQAIQLSEDSNSTDPKELWANVPEEKIFKHRLRSILTKSPPPAPTFTPTIPPSLTSNNDDSDKNTQEDTTSKMSETSDGNRSVNPSTPDVSRIPPALPEKRLPLDGKTEERSSTPVVVEREQFKASELRQRKPKAKTESDSDVRTSVVVSNSTFSTFNLLVYFIIALVFFFIGRATK